MWGPTAWGPTVWVPIGVKTKSTTRDDRSLQKIPKMNNEVNNALITALITESEGNVNKGSGVIYNQEMRRKLVI